MSTNASRHELFNEKEMEMEKVEMKFFCANEYCRKICGKFLPDIEHHRKNRCSGCHYQKSEHLDIPNAKRWTVDAQRWRSEIHVEYVAWKSFAKLLLSDEVNSVEKQADVAIVANDTHPQQLIRIFSQRWMLEKPSFVIAVSGGQRHLNLTSKQSNRFKMELSNAVASSKCWIIGGGTLSGVDYLVGQALRELQFRRWIVDDENEFYLLGLVNWDCIDLKTKLDKKLKKKNSTLEDLHFMIKHGGVESALEENEFMTTLNPLYSHFLCVEGGVKGKPFQERECRNELLSYIAKPFDDFTVPSVLVIVGGELETLAEVSAALNDEIPVVLCEGTGGACDVICYALRMADRQENKGFTDEQREYIVQQMDSNIVAPKKKGTLFTEDGFTAAVELNHLWNCVEKRKNIFIYRINPSLSMPLNQCILKALLNGKTAQTKDPVELALEWNRCDDVIKDILTHEGGDMTEKRNMDYLMTRAILEDKIEFVELFIEFGFEFAKYLTPKKLASLYAHGVSKRESPLRTLLEMYAKSPKSFTLNDVYQIIYRFSSAKPEKFLASFNDSENTYTVFQDPFRELFIWAILTDRMEASLFFWKYCQNGLSLALIGSVLWRAIAGVTHSVDETKIDELLENAQCYLDHAQDTLVAAWNINKSLAHVTLELKPRALGRKSILDIAGFIEAKEFIAHPCCQVVLEHQWKGRLNCTLAHVFIGLLFPVYLNFISVTKKLIPGSPAELWHQDVPIEKVTRDDEGEEKEPPVSYEEAVKLPDSANDKTTKNNKNPVEAQNSLEGDEMPLDEGGDGFADKLALFYGVPVTKFVVHFISYIGFLIVYSVYYMFYYSEDGSRGFYELLVVWIWIASYLDLIQSLVTQNASWWMKINLWVKSEWNLLDFCYLNIALVSFAFRGHYPGVAKGWYGIVCLLMWVRLLRFYTCSPMMGPMWIMIRKMLVELVIFLSVLGVLILASGIFLKVQMNMYGYQDAYSGDANSMEGWKWLFLRPFFMFNGEFLLDPFDEAVNEIAPEHRDTMSTLYFSTTLFICFFGNALLLNLIIAIFGTIYSEVQSMSDREWKTEMFLLVKEYENKPHFPPPFSIIESVVSLVNYVRHSMNEMQVSMESIEAERKSTERYIVFENYCVDKILKERDTRVTTEQQVQSTIMCVDSQHSRLFDMGLLIQDIDRAIHSHSHTKAAANSGHKH